MLRSSHAPAAQAAGVSFFDPLEERALAAILADLRAGDLREIMAVLPASLGFEHLSEILCANSVLGAIFCADGAPAAAIGLCENWPGVWEGWSFGTRGYRACHPQLAEWCRHVARPAIARAGVHRVHVKSLRDYTEAHRWISWLGLTLEGTQYAYGRGGEDFVTFAWVKSFGARAPSVGSAAHGA